MAKLQEIPKGGKQMSVKMKPSWTHSICFDCWVRQCRAKGEEPTMPVQVKDHKPEKCCYCSRLTIEGIFVRDDPKKLKCGCMTEV
jgi:hypothetical protein